MDIELLALTTLNRKWLRTKTSLHIWWIHIAATNTLDRLAEQAKPKNRISLSTSRLAGFHSTELVNEIPALARQIHERTRKADREKGISK